MNRRGFLESIAGIAAAAVLPKLAFPAQPSGFARLAAEDSLGGGLQRGSMYNLDNFGILGHQIQAARAQRVEHLS